MQRVIVSPAKDYLIEEDAWSLSSLVSIRAMVICYRSSPCSNHPGVT